MLTPAGQQCSGGNLGFWRDFGVYGEFTGPVRRCGGEGGGVGVVLKKQMKQTSVGSSAVLPVQFEHTHSKKSLLVLCS